MYVFLFLSSFFGVRNISFIFLCRLEIYNDDFFEALDGVCNALDNLDARKSLFIFMTVLLKVLLQYIVYITHITINHLLCLPFNFLIDHTKTVVQNSRILLSLIILISEFLGDHMGALIPIGCFDSSQIALRIFFWGELF